MSLESIAAEGLELVSISKIPEDKLETSEGYNMFVNFCEKQNILPYTKRMDLFVWYKRNYLGLRGIRL